MRTGPDVILPAAAYPEEAGLFVKHRRPPAAGVPRELPARRGAGELGDPCARFSAEIGATQPWNNIGQLRRALTEAVAAIFGAIDAVPVKRLAGAARRAAWKGRLRTFDHRTTTS